MKPLAEAQEREQSMCEGITCENDDSNAGIITGIGEAAGHFRHCTNQGPLRILHELLHIFSMMLQQRVGQTCEGCECVALGWPVDGDLQKISALRQ